MENRKAILVIDMVNDFILPGAPLEVAGARATIPAIRKFLDYGRKNDFIIIHIIRLHHQSGIDVEMTRRHLFKKGKPYCVPGTKGAEIVSELEPHEEDYIINKTRFSAFFGTGLDTLLRSLKVNEVYITGTQYPNCIRATAVDAMSLDYNTIVCTDCCSAASVEVAKANIRDLKNMGIPCLSSIEIMPPDTVEKG